MPNRCSFCGREVARILVTVSGASKLLERYRDVDHSNSYLPEVRGQQDELRQSSSLFEQYEVVNLISRNCFKRCRTQQWYFVQLENCTETVIVLYFQSELYFIVGTDYLSDSSHVGERCLYFYRYFLRFPFASSFCHGFLLTVFHLKSDRSWVWECHER